MYGLREGYVDHVFRAKNSRTQSSHTSNAENQSKISNKPHAQEETKVSPLCSLSRVFN
jgi:hypothetical protein